MTRAATDQLVRQALAQFRAGHLAEAESVTHRVLATARTHGDALSLLGLIAYERGRFDDAAGWHRKAIAANRREPLFLCNLASTHVARGRMSEALACYERALKLAADHPEAIAGLADVLERRGRLDRAAAVLAPFIADDRPSPKMSVIHARITLARDDPAGAATFVERQLARRDLADAQRRSLHFLHGRALLILDRHDDAFAAFRAGNEVEARPFDAAAGERRIAAIMTLFEPATRETRPVATNRSELPVFIVGMPRSGSTLIEQIIHAHPEAHGAGEIPDLALTLQHTPVLTDTPYPSPRFVNELTTAALDRLAERYLGRLRKYAPTARRIVNKSLENHDRLGLILMMLPGARVIHARRNPLDVCLSCYFQDLSPQLHPYASDLQSLGLYYRQYTGMMSFWRDSMRNSMLEVDYEELVSDQLSVSRRIIEFLGLGWDESCLRFHEARRDVSTISYHQVRQPIYRSALARHAHFEEHLGPLRAALGDVLAASRSAKERDGGARV